jgi:hypothetical protein
MSSQEWFFAILLGLWIIKDFYEFIFRDKIDEKRYKRTVEDTSWNTNRKKRS